jgi:pyruvate dehydrogenase E2 component (dihydrolipoamide acetyltransferase)
MSQEFKLPVLAENVEKVTVTRVMVAIGDMIARDQPVLEIETDKASAEVPSSVGGKVTAIMAHEGDTLKVGDVVLVVESDGKGTPEPTKNRADHAAEALATVRPTETPRVVAKSDRNESGAGVAKRIGETREAEQSTHDTILPLRTGGTPPPLASPSVRRLAREIGIDINDVEGTGPGGRVTIEDVKSYSRSERFAASRAPTPVPPRTVPGAPPGSRAPAEREAMNNVRRRTAENMTLSWTTIPHVTQYDQADITELEEFRRQYGKRVEEYGAKLTVTAILVKILAGALKRFPQFNASVDMEKGEVILKRVYNIGVAVDTDRGLIVPVIHDADRKNIVEIAIELNEKANRARERKSKLEDMQGATFTLSNLGGIGGTAFSPIVNPPEVAILGVSRSRIEPVYQDGTFVPRTMLPLSLSYDHRVIDGADGARFLRWVAEALERPLLSMLEG